MDLIILDPILQFYQKILLNLNMELPITLGE